MSHESGLPNAIDRAVDKPEQQSLVFHGDRQFLQSGELNEMQTIARNRAKRVANLVASDGDRIVGAEAVIDLVDESVLLTAGKIYIGGDVLDVAEATLDVAITGRVEVGVRLVKSWVTSEDDATLLGQVPGSLAEGEPGAAREVHTLVWALSDDEGDGQFFGVYIVQDGTVLDQTPPPVLSGFTNALGVYDYSAHGHYIVKGNRVTALGPTGDGAQMFSIEQGEANVHGQKITRFAALRFSHTDDWDVSAVPGETHSYVAGASHTFSADLFPIHEIASILLTKEKTVSVTRGGVANGADALPDSSVIEIVEVTQDATTYVETTSYTRVGNSVDWAAAGDEPAGGSSYNVTYRYRDSVTADSFTDTEITVSGGIDGGDIIVAYTWKVPRIDLICLNQSGDVVYVKGVSSATSGLPPSAPVDLLKLAEVHNNWMSAPRVDNNGTYNRTFEDLDRLARAQENLIRLTMIERSKSSIDQREPVAKKNMFVDPLIDDTYRDAGEAQTAAVFDGIMQLAIDPTFYNAGLTAPVMLDYVEEEVITQELSTSCILVNPYQNFTPMPAGMTIDPASDFWVVNLTEWASATTQEFNRGVLWGGNGPLEQISQTTRLLGNRTEQAEFLRPIDVTVNIEGMGGGENLETLTFDGIDVKPVGTQTADGSGNLSVSFTIPEGITAGSKAVLAAGEGGSQASSMFTGEGIINVETMQRVTTIERWTWDNNWWGGDDGFDPQAQTFTPIEPRQMVGVNVKLCAVGDDTNNMLIHQVTMNNGWPEPNVVAEAFVPMAGVEEGWVEARYNFPVLTTADREHAFVVKTDDGEHALSAADLGDFDAENQKWVSVHPYPVGVRLSSVNARTWTPHQSSALTFRMFAAKFTSTTKTVDLGEHDLVNCSDLQVRASVLLPSGDCSVVFEIERGNGTIYRLLPGQVLQLTEYLTETVELRAILTGTTKLSPVLYAPVILVAGEIATTATYVTRAFNFGADIRLTAYFKAFLPAGATATVKYDLADDSWVTLPLVSTENLAFTNWYEPKHEDDEITGDVGRLQITLTGGPAARVLLGDLGAAIF